MEKRIQFKTVFTLCFIFLLHTASGFPADTSAGHQDDLYLKYAEIHAELANTPFGVPIIIETLYPENKIRCDVYGVYYKPFDDLSAIMGDPMNWSELLLLHTNIKSCTVEKNTEGRNFITIYCGRKYYQSPEDTHHLSLEFTVLCSGRDYFNVKLDGPKGPFFTRNYVIRVEAIPLQTGNTFIRLSCEYDTSKAMESALKLYYATLGRKKVGFTVVDTDEEGNPVYVKGNQGIIERNSVRFYFCIQSFMETLNFNDQIRFQERIRHWYGLVSQFPEQLYELSREEYIGNKHKEYRNQKRLQEQLAPFPLQ